MNGSNITAVKNVAVPKPDAVKQCVSNGATKMVTSQSYTSQNIAKSSVGCSLRSATRGTTEGLGESHEAVTDSTQDYWVKDKSFPKCSPEEIERKKQEALKKRQNRLKLSKKK